jgi:hypothetical protein
VAEELTVDSPVIKYMYRMTNKERVEKVSIVKESQCFVWAVLYRKHWINAGSGGYKLVQELKRSEDIEYFNSEKVALATALYYTQGRIQRHEDIIRDQKIRIKDIDERIGLCGDTEGIMEMAHDELYKYICKYGKEDKDAVAETC